MATVQNQNSYESWYESFEGKQEGKFMTWYHSYEGKKVINIIYSAGASVVIVGALFKILHWPGASIVLMMGMFTEAFLFLIGVLEAPHEEFHWGNVFPQLIEYGSPDERVARSKAELGMAPAMGAAGEGGAAPKAGVSPLSDKELEALKDSMNDLAKTAGQLSELGKLATSTNKLGEKMDAASEAAAKYAESASALGDKSAALSEAYTTIASNMQNVVEGTKNYDQAVSEMGKKLASLNAVYELQLTAVQAQADAYKAQASEVAATTQKIQAVGAGYEKIQAAANETLKVQEEFDASQKKLAQQIADLNKIYGNMLNALA
ncbi:MAG: gliding motility protein GldL [Paludibacteraceae bacterium]|nr:gliding motility protein GldL [Paludibacteraceae bacterium]